jgi:CDP-diacylglycerol--serine O-phosphatidyltransferase
MVSNIPMFSLKFHNFNINENFKRYVLMFAAVLFVICYGMAGLAWTIVLYLLISLFTRDHS